MVGAMVMLADLIIKATINKSLPYLLPLLTEVTFMHLVFLFDFDMSFLYLHLELRSDSQPVEPRQKLLIMLYKLLPPHC